MRFDLQVIASWIKEGSTVLDLGCGEGDLLHLLKSEKGVCGTGIDCDESKIARCIERGLSVLQGDINEEIEDYPDKSFDYVIVSQTLQQVYRPDALIGSLLRIGRKVIVSFPNFGHWRIGLQVLLTGYAPVTSHLPYQWYDTPNIRVITIKDFRRFSREMDFSIITEVAMKDRDSSARGRIVRILPTVRATYGIFMIGERTGQE